MKVEMYSTGTLPTKANKTDAGWDLYVSENTVLYPNKRTLVPTGTHIKVTPDPGYLVDVEVRTRSSAWLKAIDVLPGTIDQEYQREIKVGAVSSEQILLQKGDRIAQLVITQIPDVEIEILTEPPEQTRGGFGTSGR